MPLHFTTVSEYLFLSTFQEEKFLYPNQEGTWNRDDFIVFLVDNQLAGLAKIVDDSMTIQFVHMLEVENRPDFIGPLRDQLIASFGMDFEARLFHQPSLTDDEALSFLRFFDTLHNDLHFYFTESPYLYEIEEKKEQKRQLELIEKAQLTKLAPTTFPAEKGSLHTQSQFFLKEIAKIAGCDTWIASNDQNRAHKGQKLGSLTMHDFPKLKVEDEVAKRIALIDTIWFQDEVPVCVFETETTTSVYSGILRMGDLLAVMPHVDMKLYIVAPLERKEKVLKEMNRPLFRKIGLTDYCKYIPLENLEVLLQKITGLDGFISPHVLDSIAISPKN